jgi:hypothetical protein
MSIKHLKLLKKYLDDYLKRSFIIPSDASFALPILFIKKPRGG